MSTEAQKRASEKYRLSHKDYYNKKSREYAKKLRTSQKDYKQRIDKAIKFIKEKQKVFEWYDTDLYWLLNILQGSDKE